MKKCPNCGTKNADSAKQCNFCDTKLSEEIKVEEKSANYVHDEKTAKKRRTTGTILLVAVFAFIIIAVIGVGKILFSSDKTTKAEEVYSVFSKTLNTDRNFSGSVSGNGKSYTFNGEIRGSAIDISINGGKYKTISLSKEGMKCNDESVDSSDSIYNIYTAYLVMTSTNKNLLDLDSDEIENHLMPIIEKNIVSDFSSLFNKSDFIKSVSSLLAHLKNEDNFNLYFEPTLPDDIENGEVSFKISTYDLQNNVLKELKPAFKTQAEYDLINNLLKDAKSSIKDLYKAEGSFKTENGSLKSANCDMTYKGKDYSLTVNFE